MVKQAGELRLYAPKEIVTPWLKSTGLPITNDNVQIQSNDCVFIAGAGSRLGSGSIWGSETTPRNFIQEKVKRRLEESLQMNPSSVKPWLMNERSSEIAALADEEVERRLRREGMPTLLGVIDSNSKRVSVAVWGLDAIEIRNMYTENYIVNGINYFSNAFGASESAINKPFLSNEHSLWKPAERLAVRALYALGLDCGQVELMLNEQRRFIVTGITTEIQVRSAEGESKLSEAVSNFAHHWNKETAFGVSATLGADPEFILLTPEGRIVPASRYFSPEGSMGCDSVRIRGEKRWPLVELRPKPSLEPAVITADVRRLLGAASRRIAGVPLIWRAGSSPVPGLPLGGHVHLSGMMLTSERLRALDNVVALPFRLLEPPNSAKRRPRYGSLGDVRRQPHGGFEYRTPPSWLVSPRLALGVFALAKIAAEHSRELAAHRPLDEDGYRDAFYEGDRSLLIEAADRIYSAIRSTSAYKSYSKPIDFLFDAISRHRSWDETADIRSKWRIPII